MFCNFPGCLARVRKNIASVNCLWTGRTKYPMNHHHCLPHPPDPTLCPLWSEIPRRALWSRERKKQLLTAHSKELAWHSWTIYRTLSSVGVALQAWWSKTKIRPLCNHVWAQKARTRTLQMTKMTEHLPPPGHNEWLLFLSQWQR